VIEATRRQLIKDHPEFASWLAAPAASTAPTGRVNAVTEAVAQMATAPKSTAGATHYSGEVEGGYVVDTGNTQGSSLNSKAKITRDSEDWRFLMQGAAENDNDGHVTTKETYRALGQANYKLKDDERLMTTLLWTSDRFSGFRDRYEEVSGLSNDWKLPDKAKLTTELAAGARELELVGGQTYDEPILWLRGDVQWPFAENWTFSEDARNSIGTQYTFITSNTALTLQMAKAWKLRLAFEADYDNKPPFQRKALDTNTLLNLVYAFN
jgi:putative salt-induced outer membrane protein